MQTVWTRIDLVLRYGVRERLCTGAPRDKFTVKIDDTELILPKKEFELLEILANSPGKVFSREKILAQVSFEPS